MDVLGDVISFWERASFVLGVLAFVFVLGALLWTRLWPSFALMRRFFYGQRRGRTGDVLSTLLRVYFTSWDFKEPLTLIAWDIYDKVRIRIEHEIFYPRPEPETLGGVDAAYKSELAAWRKRMSRIYTDSTIGDDEAKDRRQPLTAGVVNEKFNEIIRYFVVLKQQGASEDDLKFLATTQIRKGFVAPVHLLAGLLQRFASDWRGIIDAYDEDVRRETVQSEGVRKALGALRRMQKFIFDCWLQWGPSIPMGAGGGKVWGGPVVSVQYGFGDENNSIDLVGHRPAMERMLNELWADDQGVLAKSASVEGRLAHSMVLGKLKKDIGEALKVSWRVDDEMEEGESESEQLDKGRVVLLLSEQNPGGKGEAGINTFGAIQTLPAPEYYSAYLWVIFVVLRSSGDAWIPAHPDPDDEGRTAKPWLDLIPFFEHGNLACHRAFAFTRTQLARKALSGLAQMVEAGGGVENYPLRFAFACSIDETGDGARLWFDGVERGAGANAHGPLCREIEAMLAGEFKHIAPVVRMSHYAHGGNPHSAGDLPEHVRAVYDHIEAVRAKGARRRRVAEEAE